MTYQRLARRPPGPGHAAVLTLVATLAMAGCGGGAGAGGSRSSSTRAEPSQAAVPAKTGSSSSAGSGGTASARTSAPNPAADTSFVSEAEAICARRNTALRAAGAVGASGDRVASVVARRAAIERQALAGLGNLRPPAEVARDWHTVVTYTRLTLMRLTRLGEYARSHSATRVSRFGSATSGQVRFRLLVAAEHAGVKQCALVP